MDYQGSNQETASQYVGVGRRFVATLLDSIILAIVSGIIGFITGSSFNAAHPMTPGQTEANLLIGLIIYVVYYVVLEATMGATLGKLALGIRIVNQDGSSISWGQAIIRTVLRIIDGILAYLVGAIFIWTSSTKQRLGDKAAHTYVVRR